MTLRRLIPGELASTLLLHMHQEPTTSWGRSRCTGCVVWCVGLLFVALSSADAQTAQRMGGSMTVQL